MAAMSNETSTGRRRVFVSYAHADAAWVRRLAENLHQSGVDVLFDEWEIGPGDVLIHALDAMLLASTDGILVVSPASMASRYVRQEYAALAQRAIEGGRRLIPVLLEDAELPPLLATYIWVDFRHADGPDYLARVAALVRALSGERPGPPPRTGLLTLPDNTGYTAVGTRSCRLAIGSAQTVLTGEGMHVAGPPPRPDFDFGDLHWQLQRARAQVGPLREADDAHAGSGTLDAVLDALGSALAAAFVPTAVAAALADAVTTAARLNSSLQIALDVEEPFADLPWETLRLPQTGALALLPGVELFRRIATGGPAPAVAIPGPLRILVAIGSPEAQNARGELLDMEAELQRILDATEAPRRAGKALVHILEQGSVQAIHDALAARRYHVLHISCHAAPGTLILETANGEADNVTAQRLCTETIPAERMPPLVVLAGCSTARDASSPASGAAAAPAGTQADRLPGLARMLVTHGAPAVVAMQAPVSDRYATELMGCVYEALANWEEPDPLGAPSATRAASWNAHDRSPPRDARHRQNGRHPPTSPAPARCGSTTRTRHSTHRKNQPLRSSIRALSSAASATWWAAAANNGWCCARCASQTTAAC